MISDINSIAISNAEVQGELIELFDSIPMLGWMVSSTRPRARDLKRKDGKIEVDIAHPHIIEEADYFRQAAIKYHDTGKYCDYFPSLAPSSPYKQFWDEEKRRCIHGYVRESDGEWVTGYHYFYLNYSPILKTVIVGERAKDGSVRAERIADFPDFYDGDYLFFHYIDQAEAVGKYGAVLKARGKGYSYKAASMLVRNFLLFHKSKSYALAADSEYLDTDGILNKVSDVYSFNVSHVGFSKNLVLVDTIMHKKTGYKKVGSGGEFGFLSEVIGVTLKNDPDKARGKRGKAVLWEEAGSFPNILKSWRIAQKSMEDGNRVFGLMLAFGTGGEEGANFTGLESLFYRSKAYRVYSIKNVFDINAETARCAFFVGDYLNRADCYDKNGNSDVVKAVYEVLVKRQEVKYNTNDATDYAQVKAEECLTPQEAVMRVEGTIFPVNEIKNYLSSILPNEKTFIGQHYVGELIWRGSDMVDFIPKFTIYPIHEFPYKGGHRQGAIELFELPKVSGGSQRPEWGRYIGGCDPVDDDIGTSLFSIFILDLNTDSIVAEYTGRQDTADANFEIALKLAIYYNAELNYENKLKGLFDYFNRMNALRYLANTPESLKDMDYVKQIHTIGNKAHPYSQEVVTPNGIKLWGNIKIGDLLFSSDNRVCKVIDIPFDEITNIYKVELKDGRIIYTSGNHLWSVTRNYSSTEKLVTTTHISNNLYRSKQNYKEYNYYIPKNEGIEFSLREVPIDPYTLGLLLGDGSLVKTKGNRVHFASGLEDLKTYSSITPYEFTIPSDDRHMFLKLNNAKQLLLDLGLRGTKSHTKFIPKIYLYNTREVRLNLLKGLMGTDGSVDGVGIPTFVTTSELLIKDVAWLCRSLGYNCSYKERESYYLYKGKKLQGKNNFKLNIFTTDHVFNLARKNNKISKTIKGRSISKRFKTAIVSVTFSHVEMAKCVTVDSIDNCYLIGDFVKTHNSKGTPPSPNINKWGRRLQADWMVTTNPYYPDAGINLSRIRSIPYLRECAAWREEGNYDRVSACNMLFILRANKLKYVDAQKRESNKQKDRYADDEFFSQNSTMTYLSTELDF